MTTVPGFESIKILPYNYPRYDLKFKLIVVGNTSVGKTCLLTKATINQFNKNNVTTICTEIHEFNMEVENQIVKLKIWDTGGQERFRSLTRNYFRSSSLAIIVYAINE